MTSEEITKKIIKDNLNNWFSKVNEWGGMLSEDEKNELIEKGGVL